MKIPKSILKQIKQPDDSPLIDDVASSRRFFLNTVLALLGLGVVAANVLIFGGSGWAAIRKWWMKTMAKARIPPMLPGDPCPGCGMG